MKPKILTREDILRAMKFTKSNAAAARYLHVSFDTYKKQARLYKDEESGKSLYELHLNRSGKGVQKMLLRNGIEPELMDLLEGRIRIDSYTPEKLKARLIREGMLLECCNKCGFSERRVLDLKVPLLLNFIDGNKQNWFLENLEMLCYNCFFLHIGNIFSARKIQVTEDNEPKPDYDINKTEGKLQLDPHYEELLKTLGLGDDPTTDDGDGSEYISRF